MTPEPAKRVTRSRLQRNANLTRSIVVKGKHKKTPETPPETKETPPETKETPLETKETPPEAKETPPETKETPPETKETAPKEPKKSTPETTPHDPVPISGKHHVGSLELETKEPREFKNDVHCGYTVHPEFVSFNTGFDHDLVESILSENTKELWELHHLDRLNVIPEMYMSVDVVTFLHHECGVQFSPGLMLWACLNRRLDMVKALRENGAQWGTATCWRTAGHGGLRVLRYLHQNGCDWNADTCAAAAENGHLQVLKYAHEQGCPFNIWVSVCAARSGNADILQYVTEHGSIWNNELMQLELPRGGMEVVEYAHTTGFEWNESAMKEAATQDIDIMKFLHARGCPWDEQTCWHAAVTGNLPSLKYAHENGCPWDHTVWQTRHNHIRQYLHKHYPV